MVPDRFYYFSPLDSDNRKEWLRILLAEHRIWFRDPSTLNDVNELRPRFVFEGTHRELTAFAHDLHEKQSRVRLSPARRLLEVQRFVRRLKTNPREFEHVLHDLLAHIGVLSLSASATDQRLWAHYAAGHSGVCIEFDATVGLFGAAQSVQYVDELPTINRLKDSPQILLQKAMFTKLKEWSHEQEWRVIARWRDEVRIAVHLQQHAVPDSRHAFVSAQNGPGYYEFPTHAIRRILLGLRTSKETRAWLDDVLQSRDSPIMFTQLQRRDDGTLEIPD